MAVINTIELEGVSERSWGEAAREALREAAKTIRGINRLEVISRSVRGHVHHWCSSGHGGRGLVRISPLVSRFGSRDTRLSLSR